MIVEIAPCTPNPQTALLASLACCVLYVVADVVAGESRIVAPTPPKPISADELVLPANLLIAPMFVAVRSKFI